MRVACRAGTAKFRARRSAPTRCGFGPSEFAMKRPSSLAVLCLLVLGARAAHAAPMIVAPTDTLQDAAVRIRVDGLMAGARYDVRSDFAGHGGSVWRSRATFV